jgi:hypothetical protein
MPNILQTDICCSRPPEDPNYTICFPAQQLIPGDTTEANPFYDFTNEVSYWTYIIQIDDGGPVTPDLSHWVLQICPELTEDDLVVEISIDGGLTFTPINQFEVLAIDPPTGIEDVLKIEREQDKGTTVIYRITISDPDFFNLAAEPATLGIDFLILIKVLLWKNHLLIRYIERFAQFQ